MVEPTTRKTGIFRQGNNINDILVVYVFKYLFQPEFSYSRLGSFFLFMAIEIHMRYIYISILSRVICTDRHALTVSAGKKLQVGTIRDCPFLSF